MVKETEMQGPVTVPNDIEDEVFILNESGKMVKLEVQDDADEKGSDE